MKGIAWLFGLCAMLPYVAVPAGNSSGFSATSLLSVVVVALIYVRRPTAADYKMAPIWIPRTLLTSVLFWLLVASLSIFLGPEPDQSGRAAIIWMSSLLPLFGAYALGRVGAMQPVIYGVAAGIVIQLGFSVFQLMAYGRGEFPFAALYQNVGYAELTPAAQQAFALYSQRPFGWFPEPSAAAATMSTAGMLLLIASKPLWMRVVGGLGAAYSFVSISGFSVLVAAGLLGYLMHRSRNSWRALLASLVLVPLVVAGGFAVFGSRTSVGDFSWSSRFGSVARGLELLLDTRIALIGVGPGRSFSLVAAADGTVLSVSSVIVKGFVEFGIPVMVVVTACAFGPLKALSKTALAVPAFLAISGLMLATSYEILPGPWVLLGLCVGAVRADHARESGVARAESATHH